jgi:hypothetical protein
MGQDSLVQLAANRYEQLTNPPNQLGKLLAGSLKSSNCVTAP